MTQTPDPPVQLLKNDILFALFPLDVGHSQVVLRVVAPKRRESPVLFIQYRKIVAKLNFVVDWDSSVSPVFCLVICQGFALQNTAFAVILPRVAPVNIGESVFQISMLIEIVVIRDDIARPPGVKVRCNRLQHMSHSQLVGVRGRLRLHAPLFDHPKFQGCRPRRQTEDNGNIAAANGILNISLRTVRPAFQPSRSRHTCAVAQNIRCSHYHFTSRA